MSDFLGDKPLDKCPKRHYINGMEKKTRIDILEKVRSLWLDRYPTQSSFCNLLSISTRTLRRWLKGDHIIPDYIINYLELFKLAYYMDRDHDMPFEEILNLFELYTEQSNLNRRILIEEIMEYKKITKAGIAVLMGYSSFIVHEKLRGYGKISDQFLKHFLLLREFKL
jgi:hypothetical protein